MRRQAIADGASPSVAGWSLYQRGQSSTMDAAGRFAWRRPTHGEVDERGTEPLSDGDNLL